MSIPYDYGRSFKADDRTSISREGASKRVTEAAPMPWPSAGIVVPQFAAALADQPSSCRDDDGLVRNY